MLDDLVARYRERMEALRTELEAAPEMTAGDRVQVRDRIVELFREVEGAIGELERVKDGVKPLVDRYRELFPRGAVPSTPPRVDHLGSSTYRERGWSAIAGADFERAARELRRALELDPEDPANRSLLAWAYLRLGDLDAARELLEAVLARDPGHPLARTNLGYLQMQEGHFAEAIENLSAVVRGNVDPTATLYANLYLGIVYAERDMHRDAQSFFRRALELGPNLTEAYWELGCSYRREGNLDLALEAWTTGGTNRFNPWGERCSDAAQQLAADRESEEA